MVKDTTKKTKAKKDTTPDTKHTTAILNQDFESAVKELENIIHKMESGKLSLADSLKSFEHGIILTNHCQSLLSNAQQKVQILMQEQNETFQDFVLGEDEDTNAHNE